MTAPIAEATTRAVPNRRRRILAAIAVGFVAAVTLYTGVVASLWAAHAARLRSDVDGLTAQLADLDSENARVESDLETARTGLDTEVQRIIDLANDKAQSEDYAVLYLDGAEAMAGCVDEMAVVLDEYYHRTEYVVWTIGRHERETRAYCVDVANTVAEIVAEREASS